MNSRNLSIYLEVLQGGFFLLDPPKRKLCSTMHCYEEDDPDWKGKGKARICGRESGSPPAVSRHHPEERSFMLVVDPPVNIQVWGRNLTPQQQ